MPAPCPDTIPPYYPTTLHIIATLSLFVNLLGFYLVWYHSPGMKHYKYCLFYLQSVAFLTELHMSWICPGYYFFPMTGGYNLGEFFRQFIDTHLSMTLYIFILSFVMGALLLCVVYRHYAASMINQSGSGKMYMQKTVLLLTHLFPFAVAYCFYQSNLTQEQKYTFVKEKFPQCLFWLEFEGFEVYDFNLNPWLIVTGIGGLGVVFLVSFYGLLLGLHTMFILQRLRPHVSPQTYQIHRTALISLGMQLVIPTVLIEVPLHLCTFVVMTDRTDWQEIATDSMFLLGSHSMCQSTVMILSNPRYRKIVGELVMAVLRPLSVFFMPAPCPESIPPYYPTTLHVIATISIFVNLAGFYLILYQSPGMKHYKYCLIYMQTATFVTEIHMSWICPGYYFFPMVGGYNTGEFFGQFISAHTSMTIWVCVFCFELAAGLLCFVYRHYAAAMINQHTAGKMYVEKTSLFLTHLFPFAVSFCLYKSQLTDEQKYTFINEKFPQCLFWLKFAGVEVYDYHLNPWIAVTGIGAFSWVFVIAWYCFYLGVHTMIILQRLRPHMSPQTYQIHKTALISLAMQLVVPGVLIIVPLDLCMFVVITENTDWQEIATDSMFLVGSHSMCQCTVMILSNPRYRRIVKERLKAVFRLDFMTNLQISGSSVDPSQRTNSFVRNL